MILITVLIFRIMLMILIVEKFSKMDTMQLKSWFDVVNSKCKPNKGVITRNNLYCHHCVIKYEERVLLFQIYLFAIHNCSQHFYIFDLFRCYFKNIFI